MEKKIENNISDTENKTAEENEVKEELTVEEKLEQTEEKLLRSLAEVENQRRRFEKEIKEALDYGGFNFAKEMISILDNLQRARISIKNDETLKINKDLDKFLGNIDILEKDLVSIFEKNKIQKINCINEKFNPNFHQAMLETEDANVEPGTVLQEIQAGYMYEERLLRPSFVGVAKKKMPEKEEKSQN